jgi:hypothetical protein
LYYHSIYRLVHLKIYLGQLMYIPCFMPPYIVCQCVGTN